MTALPPEVGRAAEPFGVGGFEIGYVTDDGLEHRVSLSQPWATPFESCSPIRRFTSHKGQRHLSGEWWLATTNRHVTFESWCEGDYLIEFDFDPEIVGVAAQPFAVWLTGSAGTVGEHVPDFFLRTAHGSGVVIDVHPDGLIDAADRGVRR